METFIFQVWTEVFNLFSFAKLMTNIYSISCFIFVFFFPILVSKAMSSCQLHLTQEDCNKLIP